MRQTDREMLADVISQMRRRISATRARCAADCVALSRANLALSQAQTEVERGGSLAEADRLILVAREALAKRRGEVQGNGAGAEQGR